MIDLDDALELARTVAGQAADLLRGARPTEIRAKTTNLDLVTEWDTRAEDLIRTELAQATPGIPMLGEERGGGATSGPCWVVDPIDGTVNFAHGLPVWAVSIALVDDRGSAVGVVAAPALDWTFWARRGGGAFARRGAASERLAVSSATSLASAMVATGFPYDRAISPDNNFAEWEHFQRVAGACRRLGAASLDLCLVAAGVYDGYWERKLKPWDIAAGALLVVEAGGRVTDTRGEAFAVWGGEVVAATGAIHDSIVAELAACARRKDLA